MNSSPGRSAAPIERETWNVSAVMFGPRAISPASTPSRSAIAAWASSTIASDRREVSKAPAWRAFVRAQAQVSRRLDEDLREEHGLSLQEYVALLILAEAPDRQLRMGRLADSLSLSKSGATRLIDRLVDDGLVCRQSCSSDAR